MALFAAGFGAATVLPGGSEVLFTAMLAGGFDACLCLLAASAGNWLGGMSTYALGCLGKIEWLEKYCKVSIEVYGPSYLLFQFEKVLLIYL